MLRIAIVGCGKIADDHAECIVDIPGCEIVGVCDRDELMAAQLGLRLGIARHYSDVSRLLAEARPEVVHITTPPQSHYSVGKLCLEAGCHVYVEKPFTVTLDEAKELLSLAEGRRVNVTVGHNAQFSHCARRLRALVAAGYLGGPPIHLESYYSYDLGNAAYAKALLSDHHHWVRNLPGGLLQNTISHGISKIAEYLTGNRLAVCAHGFTSGPLRSIGDCEICDELRVLIHDGTTTAYFTFSSQIRPSLHVLRIYGSKNGLMMDEQQQTLIKLRGKRYRSYLDQFVPPWQYAGQYIGNSVANMRRFLKAEFHARYGMQMLIRSFYNSIIEGGPVPIPYSEIIRTSHIMELIFSQLRDSELTMVDEGRPTRALGHRC